MPMLVKKLATVVSLKMSKQYSCQVKNADSETEDLIQVLSLQMIIQSKIRLTADDLELYRKTNDLNSRETIDFNEKTESLNLFINIVKNKSSILNLIKKAQEFDLLCKQIFSQLCRKLKRNFSFALIRNRILKKINCVF